MTRGRDETRVYSERCQGQTIEEADDNEQARESPMVLMHILRDNSKPRSTTDFGVLSLSMPNYPLLRIFSNPPSLTTYRRRQ